MSEHKAFASLSSGLLARKGDARPAMRRQNFGEMGQDIDDLGWNDMGEEPGGSTAAAAAPSFGGLDDGDDNDRGVLAALGPLAGLSAQKAVQNQIQSVATQAQSVKQQQADIMAHFRIPDGEESDDGADLEDETAEMWDPEAEDDGNIFSGHTDSVAESGGEEEGENLRFSADRYASEEGVVPFAEEATEEDAAEEFAPEAEAEAEEPALDVAEDAIEAELEAPAFEAEAEEAVAEEEDDAGKVPFVTDTADEEGNNDVTMVDGYVDPASIDLSSLEDEPVEEAVELHEEVEETADADELIVEDAFVEDDVIASDEENIVAEDDDILELADMQEAEEAEDDVLELCDAEDAIEDTADEAADEDVLALAAEVEADAYDEAGAVETAEEEPAHDIVEFANDIADDDDVEVTPFELEASDEMAEAAAADQDFAEAAELHIEPVAVENDSSEAEAVETAEPVEEITDVPTVADIVPMPAKRAETIRRPRHPRAQPGSKEKAAFTLRLDKQRHLKLRLASAVTGQSAQKMLIEALDRMLEEMPELDALADSAPEAGKKAG